MQLKPEVQSLCDELRRFLAKEVDPRAMEIEASDAIPADLHQKARDLGLFGLTIPEPVSYTHLRAHET
jgi:acyl-CoA dehydrogenase